jgi:NitT/TauT family transport system permease protein
MMARGLSALLLVMVWSAAAVWVDDRSLPTPLAVLAAAGREIATGDLIEAVLVTLARVCVAFFLAMLAGSVVGYWLGRWRRADSILDLWLIILLNIPALVIIILAYVWFGLNEVAAIGAVAVTKLPNVVAVVREGARSLDPKLEAVAAIYRFSAATRLRHVVVPQLQPYLAAAARTGLSLVWKIVLVVELLGRSNGVGFELHLRFQNFDVAGILAYSLSFTAVMIAIEFAVLQPLERRARLWRVATV